VCGARFEDENENEDESETEGETKGEDDLMRFKIAVAFGWSFATLLGPSGKTGGKTASISALV